MGSFNKYKWELVPKSMPVVKRCCPKCKEKTRYVNTGKFRVNANKNSIDIWLIYQCEECKSTWNMNIYERINPKDITKEDYEKFMRSDKEFIEEYAFNIGIHIRNKAELSYDNISYEVKKEILEENTENEESIINIICKYPLLVRVDKLFSECLNISRKTVREMIEKGYLFSESNKKLMKRKISGNMDIHIKEYKNI